MWNIPQNTKQISLEGCPTKGKTEICSRSLEEAPFLGDLGGPKKKSDSLPEFCSENKQRYTYHIYIKNTPSNIPSRIARDGLDW